ncbi:hypothetical protein DM02DRAFT_233314 [Periconia macrospinosa]|uniref:Uncharacterized protein n=1 Tax=Periconia macrospinosa TaxID=97972 RepID=A0A2V1EES8_9PLEO|nr:hypothetical protein DM02DRAFT_233314 [Periconia macrospinosa]
MNAFLLPKGTSKTDVHTSTFPGSNMPQMRCSTNHTKLTSHAVGSLEGTIAQDCKQIRRVRRSRVGCAVLCCAVLCCCAVSGTKKGLTNWICIDR